MGCFIAGQYAAEEPDGGMLGYVQEGTVDEWQEQLKERFDKPAVDLAVISGHSWKKHAFRSGPPNTFLSRHNRQSVGRDIDIYHTLLVFC
jgi:hypothetical protein